MYVSESAASACESSTEDVPLRAKAALDFRDAPLYYYASACIDQPALCFDNAAFYHYYDGDDDDSSREPAHVLGEGHEDSASCGSDDQLSDSVSVGDDVPLIAYSAASQRRQPSILRRIRSFVLHSG